MSNPADEGVVPPTDALKVLEGAVDRALGRLASVTERAEAAEKKSAELNELMRQVTGAEADSGDVLSRLRDLEDENTDLRRRLAEGREGVDRLLAKVRFLENRK